MTQYYKIANLTVAMDSFGRTVDQAKPYLLEATGNADICIRSSWRALQARQPHLSDDDCEYLMTGSSFYHQLLNFDGMMLHSSAVVRDGKAYLFTGEMNANMLLQGYIQIDAIFGYAAGIGEMLLQSHNGYIELLPTPAYGWRISLMPLS